MSKQKTEEKVFEAESVKPYKINDRFKTQGFVGHFEKQGGNLIVISKELRDADIDPKTGQYSNSVVKFESKVFINGKERETYDLPGDLDMKTVFSLGQAKVIVLDEQQAVAYREYAKKLHSGQIK